MLYILLNELKIFRALGLSTLAFQLIGENIDFQSEIELVLSLLSKEYKNEIPKFLKVAAGRPEVLLGKTGQDRSENLFMKIIINSRFKSDFVLFNSQADARPVSGRCNFDSVFRPLTFFGNY